uniref:Uncharacterized protein n=1 Tax=Glossina brevipalpis TaxID=37001 RepID=A0A1A9WUR9_9MUSC
MIDDHFEKPIRITVLNSTHTKLEIIAAYVVAKAKWEEGSIVVKVFVKHDPTLPLEDHKDRVESIKKTLTLANALTEKAAYIMREYVKHSLYDRVSTRPFLTALEKNRRRSCYITPERFVKTLSSEDADGNVSMFPTDSIIRLGPYSGNTVCALLELWTEGTAPFELSQLLAYRRGERELFEKHLQGIEMEIGNKFLHMFTQ